MDWNRSPIYLAIYIFNQIFSQSKFDAEQVFSWEEYGEEKVYYNNNKPSYGKGWYPNKRVVDINEDTLAIVNRYMINNITEVCSKIGVTCSRTYFFEGTSVFIDHWYEKHFLSGRDDYYRYISKYRYSCSFKFKCRDLNRSKDMLYEYINEVGNNFMNKIAEADSLKSIVERINFVGTVGIGYSGFYHHVPLYDGRENKIKLSFEDCQLKPLSTDDQIIGLFLAMYKYYNYNAPFRIEIDDDIFYFTFEEYNIPKQENPPTLKDWY